MPVNHDALPHNIEAEKAVLGSTFLSKNAVLNVVSSLTEEDFYLSKHQTIFKAIVQCVNNDSPVDILSVTNELINRKELDIVGGVNYLKECSDSMVALASLDYYISVLIDHSVLRKLLKTIRNIDEDYTGKDIGEINDFILTSLEKIQKSVDRRRVSSFHTTKEIGEVIKEQMKTIKSKEGSEEEEITGINTGFEKINSLTNGFQPSELIIVAARPSVGKTTLAMNFAYNAATLNNVAVAIFSLEMSKEQLVKKLIAKESCVSLKSINLGRIMGKDRTNVAAAIEEIQNAKIFIDDTPGLNLMDIIAKSKKLQSSEPSLGMVVIDYLGLIELSNDGKKTAQENRQEAVRKISGALKQLARDLKVPVIVVSQLSRSVEGRDNKRPMLSDLRDSGSIEQDADVVMLLYRGDYYKDYQKSSVANKKTSQLTSTDRYELARKQKEKELGQEIPGNASYVEVNIAKNRNARVGKAGLFFYKEFARFDSPSKEWEEAMLAVSNDTGDE
ncbi:MAG: replicative DNA helicase [Bacilli bacterium]